MNFDLISSVRDEPPLPFGLSRELVERSKAMCPTAGILHLDYKESHHAAQPS